MVELPLLRKAILSLVLKIYPQNTGTEERRTFFLFCETLPRGRGYYRQTENEESPVFFGRQGVWPKIRDNTGQYRWVSIW